MRGMKLFPAPVIFLLSASLLAAAPANDRVKSEAEAETLIAKLNFRQGTIALQDGIATLNLPTDLRFLDGGDAQTVLTKLWGNPPADEPPLGMLVPADCNLLNDCWAVMVTYEESGYVKDGDAEKINYSELLTQMQKDARSMNSERQRQGYSTVELVGWAAPPRYDRATHKLYWAKDLKFSDASENTLNYNIRILGRRGVLVLNAIAGISDLPAIEQAAPKILSSVDFNPGHRYADFSASSGDKVAEYGIAALIAGGVAAKAGLFKGLWLAILAGKKFIIVGIALVAGWFKKLFGRKQKSEVAPAPAAPSS
jgi:uncharacterized membrane-anchored protein